MQRRAFVAALAGAAIRARAALSAPLAILVLAAASLTDALSEIGAAYSRAGGERVDFAFGGSGDLARQLLGGAPAAVFVSADVVSVEQLEHAGRVADRCELLANRLVVVVPSSSSLRVRAAADLAAARHVAIADPEFVPAGRYARQWLETAGVWPQIRERVVPTLDVRAALAAAETGAADAAVVYATDARLSARVHVAFSVPPAQTPRISYVAALLVPAGRGFYEHLRSPAARAVFDRFGFEAPVPARGGNRVPPRSVAMALPLERP